VSKLTYEDIDQGLLDEALEEMSTDDLLTYLGSNALIEMVKDEMSLEEMQDAIDQYQAELPRSERNAKWDQEHGPQEGDPLEEGEEPPDRWTPNRKWPAYDERAEYLRQLNIGKTDEAAPKEEV
jgi:hypothetical protein